MHLGRYLSKLSYTLDFLRKIIFLKTKTLKGCNTIIYSYKIYYLEYMIISDQRISKVHLCKKETFTTFWIIVNISYGRTKGFPTNKELSRLSPKTFQLTHRLPMNMTKIDRAGLWFISYYNQVLQVLTLKNQPVNIIQVLILSKAWNTLIVSSAKR